MQDGRLVRALAAGGAVRIVAVEVLGPARHAAATHALHAGGTRLIAEGVAAAALSSAHIKGEDRVTLQLQASRPEATLYAEVRADGSLRARVTPVDLPLTPDFDGILLAIRSDATKEVYRGMTEVRSEDLESALGRHLRTSDQVDAFLRLGATLGEAGLTAAGGVLVERLPEEPGRPSIDAESFAALYAPVADVALTDLLAGIQAGELLGEPLVLLEERPLVWRCTCSDEKVDGMLMAIGVAELDILIREDHGAEITCHFCNSCYVRDEAALIGLRGRLTGQIAEA